MGDFALFTRIFQEFFLLKNKIQSFQFFNMLLLTSLILQKKMFKFSDISGIFLTKK